MGQALLRMFGGLGHSNRFGWLKLHTKQECCSAAFAYFAGSSDPGVDEKSSSSVPGLVAKKSSGGEFLRSLPWLNAFGEAGFPRSVFDMIRAAGNPLGGLEVSFPCLFAKPCSTPGRRSQGAFVEDGESNSVAFRFSAFGHPVLVGVSRFLQG